MTGMSLAAGATVADVERVAAAIPEPASVAPMVEKTGGSTGSEKKRFALEDHQHPRVTSTTVASIEVGNTAAVAFTRTFVNEPGINYSELPAAATTTTPPAADLATNAQPTSHKVIAWQRDTNGLYTGCVVRVWRSQAVPQNLVSLLLNGVFNLFGAGVVGTRFSIIAVARSDVSAS